jgi:Cdc6-like AAA superfamily ATPase
MARTVSNVIKSIDWEDLLTKIRKVDSECVTMASMAGTASVVSGLSIVSASLADIQQKWEEIHNINITLTKLQDDWEKRQSGNAKIIQWISDIQVGEDHERVRNKLGSRYWDAGQWFLSNPEFKKWKISQQGQLWLQGSVGTGKTSLASIVVNELVKSSDGHSIAFYYCSRSAGAVSNSPTTIFRSLVAQLACTSDGEDIYYVIREWYRRDAKRFVTGSRLSLTECEELLVTLLNLRGRTVIIIDGVDECTEPMQLLRALHQIRSKYSHLKLFLTSRLDVAVTDIFPGLPTIKSDFAKTTTDIRHYIEKELNREERRNKRVITDELAARMVDILTQRAQGM